LKLDESRAPLTWLLGSPERQDKACGVPLVVKQRPLGLNRHSGMDK
jgi:hypothetical protein